MPHLKEAIIMIKESWKKVKKETIVNCWKRTGIINESVDREEILKYTEYLIMYSIKMIFFKFIVLSDNLVLKKS